MTLSDEIVQKLDYSKELIVKSYEKLDPTKYTKAYDDIWEARAEIEFLVASVKLLNNIKETAQAERWKKEFAKTLKQVRAEAKVRAAFEDTIALYDQLEAITTIEEFYKLCWMLKEKITILLNIVKPKIKLGKKKNNTTKKKNNTTKKKNNTTKKKNNTTKKKKKKQTKNKTS